MLATSWPQVPNISRSCVSLQTVVCFCKQCSEVRCQAEKGKHKEGGECCLLLQQDCPSKAAGECAVNMVVELLCRYLCGDTHWQTNIGESDRLSCGQEEVGQQGSFS